MWLRILRYWLMETPILYSRITAKRSGVMSLLDMSSITVDPGGFWDLKTSDPTWHFRHESFLVDYGCEYNSWKFVPKSFF